MSKAKWPCESEEAWNERLLKSNPQLKEEDPHE